LPTPELTRGEGGVLLTVLLDLAPTVTEV
jgi:hypothetical protein